MRTHLQDLIETMHSTHYETFRTKQMIAMRDSSTKENNPILNSAAYF